MIKLFQSENLSKNWLLITLACFMLLTQFFMHRLAERTFDSAITSIKTTAVTHNGILNNE